MFLRFVAVSLVLLAACAPAVTGVRIGPPASARASGCSVLEEQITPKDAETRYRQVVVICWSHGGAKDLEDLACHLGGDVVVLSGLCTNGEGKYSEQGREYNVYLSSRPSDSPKEN